MLFLSLLYVAPHVSPAGKPARPGNFTSIMSLIKRAEMFRPGAPDTELTSFSQVSGAILETSTSFQSTETVSVNMAPYGATNRGPKMREQGTTRCTWLQVRSFASSSRNPESDIQTRPRGLCLELF